MRPGAFSPSIGRLFLQVRVSCLRQKDAYASGFFSSERVHSPLIPPLFVAGYGRQ